MTSSPSPSNVTPSRQASLPPNTPSKQRISSSPDPNIITERLLQRHPRHNAPPQTSAISATVTPVNQSPLAAAKSQASPATTNGGTPSGNKENVISRFLPSAKGASNGSSGTPRTTSVGSSMSPARISFDDAGRNRKLSTNGDDLSRAKSTTNLPNRHVAAGQGDRDRSASPTPSALASRTKQPYLSNPSRIQQKLWLQRASSNIEQQHLRPGTGAVGGGSRGKGGSNKGDPRAPRQSDRATVEYHVIRRYKNPLGDAIARVRQAQLNDKEHAKRSQIPLQKQGRISSLATNESRLGLSQSMREGGSVGRSGKAGSRGKDGSRATPEDGEEDESRRAGDDVAQLLRRMWERGQEEVGPGGD